MPLSSMFLYYYTNEPHSNQHFLSLDQTIKSHSCYMDYFMFIVVVTNLKYKLLSKVRLMLLLDVIDYGHQ